MNKLSRSLALACTVAGLNAKAASLDLQQVFSKPLILGASVSHGFMTDSPGTRAAERYTDPTNILNVAKNGATGSQQISQLTAANLQGRTIIIGVDFAFWDSWGDQMGYEQGATASENAIYKLIATAYKAHIPLVLGDIPHTFQATATADAQPLAMMLNEDIYAWCLEKNGCYILKLADFVNKAIYQGITINGKVERLGAITTDGFHLKASASEFLADMMVKMLNPDAPLIRRPGPVDPDLGFMDEIKYLRQYMTGK